VASLVNVEMVWRLDGSPFRSVIVAGELSPPPQLRLYDDPAITTAGTDVKAIWGVSCARTETTQEAPARNVLRKRMVVEKVCLAIDA